MLYNQLEMVLYQINGIYLIFLGMRCGSETAPTEWNQVNLVLVSVHEI